MVLGRGTEHAGAANVNVLDALLERTALRDGGLERIQVEDGHVNDTNVVVEHVLLVLSVAAHGEDAAVDLGVEGLDATVQALGGL